MENMIFVMMYTIYSLFILYHANFLKKLKLERSWTINQLFRAQRCKIECLIRQLFILEIYVDVVILLEN